MRKMSFQLQQLFLLNQRTKLSNTQKNLYERLRTGYFGEIEMDRMFEQYAQGVDHLDDLTLYFQGVMVQIDKIALHGNTLEIFDMKFYHGRYRFENGEWYCGDRLLTHNILEQLRQAVRLVKGIFVQAGFEIKVIGSLVFMNGEAEIIIKEEVPENILQYDEIGSHLVRLKPRQDQRWKKVLRPFIRPAIRKIDTDIEMDSLEKGICCRHCHQLDTYETRFTIDCHNCGKSEPKQTAYDRTICEFGVLFPTEDLKKSRLIEFFGEKVNHHYLNRTLCKYFKLIKKAGPSSSYVNKAVSFEEWCIEEADHFRSLEKRTHWRKK